MLLFVSKVINIMWNKYHLTLHLKIDSSRKTILDLQLIVEAQKQDNKDILTLWNFVRLIVKFLHKWNDKLLAISKVKYY